MSANDTKIKELLTVIEKKRAKLGPKPRMSLKTNGLLKQDDKSININTINTLDECIREVANINQTHESYIKAAKLLNIEDIEMPKINGFSIEDWIDDFKLKVEVIKWAIEDKNIKSLESKLKDLRSEDLKTADALDEISKLLK